MTDINAVFTQAGILIALLKKYHHLIILFLLLRFVQILFMDFQDHHLTDLAWYNGFIQVPHIFYIDTSLLLKSFIKNTIVLMKDGILKIILGR